MTSPDEDLARYVREVHENTQKYLRALVDENDKLCELIHTLKNELDRHRRAKLHLEESLADFLPDFVRESLQVPAAGADEDGRPDRAQVIHLIIIISL